MKKRQYKAEFKRDAAYQIIIKGVAVKELSDKLGVPVSLLYRWKSEHVEELEASRRGHVVLFVVTHLMFVSSINAATRNLPPFGSRLSPSNKPHPSRSVRAAGS